MPGFDKLSDAQRSALMARIRKKDTNPEILVRRLVFGLGYRFRIHYAKLPGTPDIAFPSKKRAILVHGCFWHRHSCGSGRKVPGKNLDYWLPKFKRIADRDRRNEEALDRLGWQQLTVWECQTHDPETLSKKVDDFLRS